MEWAHTIADIWVVTLIVHSRGEARVEFQFLYGIKGKHWDYHRRDTEEWEGVLALFMWGGYWMPVEEIQFTLPLWVRRQER